MCANKYLITIIIIIIIIIINYYYYPDSTCLLCTNHRFELKKTLLIYYTQKYEGEVLTDMCLKQMYSTSSGSP